MKFEEKGAAILKASLEAKEAFWHREKENIKRAVEVVSQALKRGNKLLVFGNGGSAADAQHLAGEMINRFRRERAPLPAIALTTDTSVLTAIANDYDFKQVFVKQIEALGQPGDVALGISTSGRSENVCLALKKARALGLFGIGLGGGDGGRLAEVADLTILVPSRETPRIQEAHIFFIHLLCELVEEVLFGLGTP
ncbi:MAG TPA: SIS domain-containing protein [Thermodesulfatator atlanticus]|uniref:Phosphoheptose isomerase n=1 Tax=Thermodesulfatator atlanticus TaxID=501497 RepID=A0A7V5NYN5_9BACT|nr:SIS domain-containing protein [Thermodesulfatator atlanticus]